MRLRTALAAALAALLAPSLLFGLVLPVSCRCGGADPAPIGSFRRSGGLLGMCGAWRSCGLPNSETGALATLAGLRATGDLAATDPVERCRASHGYRICLWRTPWTWHAVAAPRAFGVTGDRTFYVDSSGAAAFASEPGGAWRALGE